MWVERVFSVIVSIRKENEAGFLKAEIGRSINIDVDCEYFYQYIKASEEKSPVLGGKKLQKSAVLENEFFLKFIFYYIIHF